MTRRILQSIQLDKIAVVDKPCQEGAIVAIMKREQQPHHAVVVDQTSNGHDLFNKRLVDMRDTLIGASFVLKSLMKQGYYVGLKHPEEGVKHFTCEAGNKRGARGQALRAHPGSTIFRLHHRNLISGGGGGPAAEVAAVAAKVAKESYEATSRRVRARHKSNNFVGVGGPKADERGIAKQRFPGGREEPRKSFGLRTSGPRRGVSSPRSSRGLAQRGPRGNRLETKPAATRGVGPRGARVLPGAGRLKGESGTNRKPMLVAKGSGIQKWSDESREAAAEARRSHGGGHGWLGAIAGTAAAAGAAYLGARYLRGAGRAVGAAGRAEGTAARAAGAASHGVHAPTPMSHPMRRHFESGYEARMQGWGREANTHKVGSEQHSHWEHGWSTAGREGHKPHLGKRVVRARLLTKQRLALNDKLAKLSALLAKTECRIELIQKVIGNTAADYIHDFVHSSNKKFKGKSKEERIRMALGAYYGNR